MLFLIVLVSLSTFAWADRRTAKQLFPDQPAEVQGLMQGYMDNFEFGQCMGKPGETLQHRKDWNQRGWHYTNYLLGKIDLVAEQDKPTVICLLGGTQDDRAAVALRMRLRRTPDCLTRCAIYYSLAEMGFYTDYHSRLLFDAAKANYRKTDYERVVRLLGAIHHPEARATQALPQKLRMLDGAVAEEYFPLLDFRDYCQGRRPKP